MNQKQNMPYELIVICWTFPIQCPRPIRFHTRPFFADDSAKVAWKKYTVAWLQSTTPYYKVLQNTTKYYSLLQSTTEY